MHKLKPEHITLTARTRLYGSEKAIIGLTGGIATGKSTASTILEKKGYTVIDADKLVKKIYQTSEALNFIKIHCPKAINNADQINFKLLREYFFSNKNLKEKIENFIYSKLPSQFLESCKQSFDPFIFYDVPLLFEKKLQSRLDMTLLIYTSKEMQLKRLVSRDQITVSLANNILKNQLPIDDKKDLANFVIDNSQDINELEKQLDIYLNHIFAR